MGIYVRMKRERERERERLVLEGTDVEKESWGSKDAIFFVKVGG